MESGDSIAVNVLPEWLAGLDEEDVQFIKQFLLVSGSLKEMSKLYGVTYPTLRLRLNRLIQKIVMNDRQESDGYIALIKRLAIDDRLDYMTAKLLVDEYKKSKGEK